MVEYHDECQYCGEDIEPPKKKWCSIACSRKSYRKRLKENGKCPECYKPTDRPGKKCSDCLERSNKASKKVKQRYINNGMCQTCGKDLGVVYAPWARCEECSEKSAKRKQEMQARRKEAGLCIECGEEECFGNEDGQACIFNNRNMYK